MSRIYSFENDLPSDKRKNVLTSFGINEKHGSVVFVIDDTVFGSCKDGVVITENYVITKLAFQAPEYYEFKFCKGIVCINKKLVLNNYKLYDFSIPDAFELKVFFEKINKDYFSEFGKNVNNVGLNFDKSSESSVESNVELSSETKLVVPNEVQDVVADENKLIGKVFVQAPNFEIGLSSYHFDAQDNIYINFEKWKESKNLPNLPVKKKFTNVKFYQERRVFIGLIDWTAEGGSPFNPNEMCWLYLMVFSKDYSKITGGHVVNDDNEKISSFSKNLNYINLSLAKEKNADTQDIALSLQAAEQGDAEVQYQVGVMLFSNEDYIRAAAWFRKAAELDHVAAQCALGMIYFQGGYGVPSSFSKATNWFYKAAKQGDATAQYYLGVIFENGYDVNQDDAKAIAWYSKAAEQGHPEALEKLGS